MASGGVRYAIVEVIEDKNLMMDLESPRIKYTKNIGKELLKKATESEQMIDSFDNFNASLYSKLE